MKQSDFESIRNLTNEIYNLLDKPEESLTPALRKATRLAVLCCKEEYKLLFAMHLDGVDLNSKNPRVEKWKDKNIQPAWNITAAFYEDRAIEGNKFSYDSLEIIESRLKTLKEMREKAFSQGYYNEAAPILEGEVELQNIVGKIRNRISLVLREVEDDIDNRTRFLNEAGRIMRKGDDNEIKSQRIFIGHGRSQVWRDLKDFLQERLNLVHDEFNRESTAGLATKERLEDMLRVATFAFLVMTGEDEHADQSLHARENVIHEIGLFQGKLGFRKAIVLLEEGCKEFSNIIGLTQIRFPKENIEAKFEEIRRVLEREGILQVRK